MRGTLGAAIVLAALCSPGVAKAADGVDSIVLAGGVIVHGTLVEIVPEDHATLRLASGKVSTIPWSQIARVVVGDDATEVNADATSAEPAADQSSELPMAGPLARVRIQTTKDVVLYRRPAGTSSWIIACRWKCDQDLPVNDTYRVNGNGMRESGDFQLHPINGVADLQISGASAGGIVLGSLLAGVGFISAYVGLAGLGSEDGNGSSSSGVPATAIGLGLGAMALGTVIIVLSAGTSVVQPAGTARPAARDKGKDAFLRMPSWREARETSAGTPPATFPALLRGTF